MRGLLCHLAMNKPFAIAILVTAGAAHAEESLEDKTYWKPQQTLIDRSMVEVEKRCGPGIAFEWVDKPKFRAAAEKSQYTPFGVCDNMVQLVASICRAGEDEKKAVGAKIKTISCGYAKARTLDLKGGKLKYMGNNDEGNWHDWAKPALTKKL